MISRIFKFFKGDLKEKKETPPKKAEAISKKNPTHGSSYKSPTQKKQQRTSVKTHEIDKKITRWTPKDFPVEEEEG
ncbi:MAG: hypothetical protein KAI45_01605, partial [Melioribacteraceae bacterium]|nr:hypothetical protein [Melioribacteraceae bacterium]